MGDDVKKRCLNNTVKLDTFTQPGSAPVIESSEFAATPSEKGRLLNQHVCGACAVKICLQIQRQYCDITSVETSQVLNLS